MAEAAIDPFTLVYDTLWSMLEEDERFSIVSQKNRLKFNTIDRQPIKTQMSTADYPEVALMSEGTTGNLCATSSSTQLTRNYSWVISAGDLRNKEIFPVEWAVFSGMLAWRHRLTLLTWEDDLFVKQLNVVDSNFTQIESQRRRGIQGFVAVWSIFVEMHFTTSKIQGSHLST